VPADSADESTDDSDAVRRDLLGVLFGHTPTIVAGNLAVASTATAVLVSADGHSAVWLWLVAICALMILRAAFVRWSRPRLAGTERRHAGPHRTSTVAIAGVTGLAWGVLPWLGYEGRDPFMDFFSVAMLVGMAGGAVTATTALPARSIFTWSARWCLSS
jgi:hypothetical protein